MNEQNDLNRRIHVELKGGHIFAGSYTICEICGSHKSNHWIPNYLEDGAFMFELMVKNNIILHPKYDDRGRAYAEFDYKDERNNDERPHYVFGETPAIAIAKAALKRKENEK